MSSWRERRIAAAAVVAAVGALGCGFGVVHARAGGAAVPDRQTAATQAADLAAIAPPSRGEDAAVGKYGYGTVPDARQVAGWSIAVLPDGTGLPAGHGSVSQGADIFASQCAACHGTFGEGEGRYPKLASDSKLTDEHPVKAVGNFWPYATTVWDYINRAMPFPAPHSLSPDEVYALTAYVLNLNNLVGDDFVADRTTLPKVVMPNRFGFILRDPRPDTHDVACMSDCRKPAEVRVTSTAEHTGLTPRTTGPLDEMEPK